MGIRRQVNLLRANGHPDAMHYPIGMVWDEAQLVVERTNGTMVTLAVLIQSATATTGMNASRKNFEHFNKLIKGLSGE